MIKAKKIGLYGESLEYQIIENYEFIEYCYDIYSPVKTMKAFKKLCCNHAYNFRTGKINDIIFFKATIPFMLEIMNGSGYHSTEICLDCLLEHMKERSGNDNKKS